MKYWSFLKEKKDIKISMFQYIMLHFKYFQLFLYFKSF